MKSEPFAKSLIATSLALSCLMAHAPSVAPVAAENGMVVTAQHLASHVGVDVLKNGGNAVDAAVAVGYALTVVYPAAGNLAVGVPGTVSGMELALSKYGTKPRKEVIAPGKAPLSSMSPTIVTKDGKVVMVVGTPGAAASSPRPC